MYVIWKHVVERKSELVGQPAILRKEGLLHCCAVRMHHTKHERLLKHVLAAYVVERTT